MDPENKLYTDNNPANPLNSKEEVLHKADPLTLELDDKEIVKVVNKWAKDYKDFYKDKYNLFERRKTNEQYIFGRQYDEKEKNNDLKAYEVRYLDNCLYEIEASIKPLAMSRLPDMIVTPGTENPGSKDTADEVGKVVDNDIKKRLNRTVLGIAFKHLPVYFVGVIKVRWDPEKDDYVFEVVHPDNIEVDQTCASNDANDMRVIAHILPITIQECLIRFPDKKDELFKQLKADGVLTADNADPSTKDLATQIKIREIWFDWYEKDPEDDKKYKTIPIVMWKYKDCVLKQMKNPNHDYEGEEKWFTYAEEGDQTKRREVIPEDITLGMMTGQMPPNVSKETVYKNYFDAPKKPFFFMGYDQWRKQPYDETSRLEQNIKNQKSIDEAGKRIIEKLKKRVKHIFSKDGGLKANDIEKMDLDDDRQDILIEGKVNDVHGTIQPEQVTPAEFKYLDETRTRMYSLAGASAIRGQQQSDVATTNQIAREADYTRADDLVEDTINAACEWMAQWILHLIKLRYTENHFRKLLGGKGSVTFIKLKNDMIEDGMEVMIKSSGTDKLKAQKNAIEMAKLGAPFTNPLDFYRDMDIDDPEGRAERGLLFATNPIMYMQKYLSNDQSGTIAALATQLNGAPPGAAPPVAPGGQPPPPPSTPPPQVPTAQNTANVPASPIPGAVNGSPSMMP